MGPPERHHAGRKLPVENVARQVVSDQPVIGARRRRFGFVGPTKPTLQFDLVHTVDSLLNSRAMKSIRSARNRNHNGQHLSMSRLRPTEPVQGFSLQGDPSGRWSSGEKAHDVDGLSDAVIDVESALNVAQVTIHGRRGALTIP
jgi:hypothetical protein